MTQLERRVAEAMIALYSGDAKRIQHFIKVNAFAKLIAEGEGTDERTKEIISLAAYVHDIGIHESEKKYGLYDYLIVDAVYVRIGVVLAYYVADSPDRLAVDATS